ncbi:MAG: PQQ-binding-like beta-propeller repeat protein [Cyclobacteriaceae bacterium]
MKYTKLTFAFLLSSIVLSSYAQQVKPLWTLPAADGVRWQMVTSLGNYIAATKRGLIGVDPEMGKILWRSADFGPLTADQVQQLGSSALLTINMGSTVYILDPFTGAIKFNSKEAGVNEIKDEMVLYRSNGILVSGRDEAKKDILLMSSLEDGKVAWKIEDDFGRFITASELPSGELLIVTLYYNYKVNPTTGKVIWKNDISEANKQLEKMGAFGALMKQGAANLAQNIDINVQFYQHPSKPIFYIASEQEGKPASTGGFTSSTTTGSGPSYHTTYSAFDLNDGKMIWDKPLDLSGKIGGVYFGESGLVVMPNDGANTKVNSYDYASKNGQWGKKGRGINVRGGIYSFSKVDGGLVLVSQNASGKNFISYLDLATANLTFDKPVQIDGQMVFSEVTPQGLLFVTTQEMNILDITSGELRLGKGISTQPSLTAQKENTIYVFDTRESVIKELNKNSGALKIVSSEIKFEGGEAPSQLEIRSNGVLVSSSQNMALVDFNSKTVYQKYFDAPREKGIIRALQYAQAVRAAYIGAVAYTASAAFESAGQQAQAKNEESASVVLKGVGSAYGELGNQASDFAKKSFQAANARYKATQSANEFTVVLTKSDNNNVLTKVNKNTGVEEGTINLGKDITPNYTMDGVTGVVFYSAGGDQIVAYKF